MAQQQSSRLHRLLTLLDSGSTQATRLAAARQIGDIAKSYPHELTSLLKKVSQYLCSRNWDTRVAAAHAIGFIAENVKHLTLKELYSHLEVEVEEYGFPDSAKEAGMSWSSFHPSTVSGLSFNSFDINKVLEFGSLLLASGGQEYDAVIENGKNPAERLARQKQNLHRRLGLDIFEQFMDVSDMIKDEDLLAQKVYPFGNGISHSSYPSSSGQNIQQLVANMVPSFRHPRRLSARELNLLKRKAKLNAKDQTKNWSEEDELECSNSQIKGACPVPDVHKVFVDTAFDVDSSEGSEKGKWPFCQFVEELIHDMFDPIWEIRHGAIMTLREILTRQGASVGVLIPDSAMDKSWLDSEDIKSVNIMKRARDIDLNTQFMGEGGEPFPKRKKTENEQHFSSCKTSSLSEDLKTAEPFPKRKKTENEQHFSSCKTSSLSEDLKTAEHLFDSTGVTGGTDEACFAANVKSDPESSISSFTVKLKEEHDHPLQGESLDYGFSTSLKTGLVDLPENSKLKSLLKIARHSCIKNWEFLQDCAIRCLCILSLDRFGDFVSDQVVAPVRETCAQALGAVLKFMHPSLVHDTLNVLVQMQCRQEWEVRHGGLLGVKYLVAVRQDIIQDLLPCVLPTCKAGLEDADDDVRAVAAEALIPAVRALVSLQNRTTLQSIVMLLWDILLDLDDLSPSTNSVMNLLAEIHTQPEMFPNFLLIWTSVETKGFDLNEASHQEEFQTKNDENPYILPTLTTRLWPFMRHNITSVRHSAIRTLERLLEVYHKESSSLAVGGIWTPSILCDTLRIVFQNLLIESDEIILQCSERVWRLLVQCCRKDLEVAATSFFPSWVQLATTPVGSALDTSKMFFPAVLPRKSHFKAAAKMRAVKLENDFHGNTFSSFSKGGITQERNDDITNTSTKIVVGTDSEKSVTQTRVVTATALGIFISKLPETSLHLVVDVLLKNFTSSSGFQRQVAAMILIAWFKELKSVEPSQQLATIEVVDLIKKWLLELLTCTDPAFPTKDSPHPYSELSRTYTKMRNEASVLYRVVDSCGMSKNIISELKVNLETLGADDAIEFASRISLPTEQFDGVPNSGGHLPEDVESSKQQLLSTAGYLKCLQNNLHVTISSLIASAIVWMTQLPARLNPIILPLMAAVKREKEEILQDKAAEALAELIFNCIGRKPSPNDKLIKNLCCLNCMDTSETPQATVITSVDVIEDQDLLSLGSSISSQRTKGQVSAANAERKTLEGFISRRGSELALMHLCQKLGSSLFDKLPKLWECLTEFLMPASAEGQAAVDEQQIALMNVNSKIPQNLINNIQIVRSVSSMVDETLKPKILSLLPSIYCCVQHCHVAVRLAAARCITSMAKTMTTDVIMSVIEKAIPMLRESTSVHSRHGAVLLLSLLVQSLGFELVPYAPILVVPLLRCMSDSDLTIRKSVTHSFAALVPLLPLSRGVHLPVKISECLSKNSDDVKFLEQLLDNSHIEDYSLSIRLKVELRRYQQEGINWLSFLRRFKLHGILCDDMGLGKTLQASAIMASDIVENRVVTNEKDSLSLIICPSTLVAHWAYEIEKYIDDTIMITLQYVGSSQERILLRRIFDKHNVIITSYDVVRKDIDFLGKVSWNYCVLDEGHIIRNPKSKVSGAVKQLKAEHRLLLSGTPIQNNVLELWSLFDFLMPGFLGTERQFQATYGKPLLAAKDSKCSTKDAEAGVLAMEALHKQVMPFLLRRTKDEVLSDLPEKIIQDRYCDLSPVQMKLYEQFSSSDAKKEISDLVSVNEVGGAEEAAIPSRATSHVFQALQYLLKLCSHPLLVLGEKPPDSLVKLVAGAIPDCSDILGELHNLQHSPKLTALREILEECGIGLEAASNGNDASVGQHRVLIFAQHRSLLDIVERDLFQIHMKSVTYLRLDGSVEPDKRFELVKTFNSDPTIDVLLLTTHVGGLGLNLTSADTLVFLEHDWNPMKDHQAMDRAHRLGQQKVVNVHRLIMRGTLEEKVMSLQRFKVSVANAIINAENASLKTMNTDQLLDLFTPAQATRKQVASVSSTDGLPETSESVGRAGKGLKAVLSGLEELWDQSQYAEEYNLNQFLAKLSS